jgi:hypothetical protein
MIEYLLSQGEVLSSNPNTTKKKPLELKFPYAISFLGIYSKDCKSE